MALDAAKIRIAVEADAASVGPAASAASAAFLNMERSVSGSLSRLRTSFNSLPAGTKVFSGFAIAAALATTALAKAAGTAIEFESAFAGVEKTVSGTPGQLAAIRDGLLDLSTIMPTSASDLAAIAENAGQLGVQASQVLEFTRVIAQLGETTDLDFDTASQSMARFLNIVEGGVGGVSRAADTLVELGNNSATTESQILTFSTRLAASFAAAGATQDQIQGVAAAFSSLGIEAEAGASSLSRVITQIVDAAKLGGPDLATFAQVAGVTTSQFAEMALSERGATEALLLFINGLGRVVESGGSVTPILANLGLEGIRTTRVLTVGALSADLLARSLAMAAKAAVEGGAAQEEYDRRLATTASRLAIVGNQLQVLAIRAGTPFLEGIADAADLVTAALQGVAEVMGPLASELLELGGNAAVLVAAFAELFGPVLSAGVGALIGVTVALTGMLEILNSLGPAGLVIALLVADLALVGPATTFAILAVDALQASFYGLSVSAGVAKVAIGAVQAALLYGPFILAAGALIALGKAWVDAGQAAEESAASFREGIAAAKEAGDLAEVTNQVGQLRDRVNDLSTTDWGFWRTASETARGFFELITPMANSVVDAKAEFDALNGVLGDEEEKLQILGLALQTARTEFGFTEEGAYRLAAEMGLLEALTGDSTAAMYDALTAMSAFRDTSVEAAQGHKDLVDKVFEGTATMGDFEEALGLTSSQLAYVADSIDGVDLEDLHSEESAEALAAFAAIAAETNGPLAEMARLAGLGVGAFIDMKIAAQELANAHDSLRSAIEGTKSALDLQFEQQRISADATDAFRASLEGLTLDTLPEVVRQMRDASLEQIGLAGSMEEANAIIARNEEALRATAEQYGLNAGLVDALILSLGNINPEYVAEIVMNAVERQAEVDSLHTSLESIVAKWIADLFLEGSDESIATAAELLGLLDSIDGNFSALVSVEGAGSAEAAANSIKASIAGIPNFTSKSVAVNFVASYVGFSSGGLTGNFSGSTVTVPRSGAPSGSSGSSRSSSSSSRVPSNVRADGGIYTMAPGGVLDFIEGMTSAGLMNRDRARIVTPSAPGTVLMGEMLTGGEAFIPLSATKRPEAISTWNETGRRLGTLPSTPYGGPAGGAVISIHAPVTVHSAPGMDTAALAREVGTQVRAAFADTARQLLNTRG